MTAIPGIRRAPTRLSVRVDASRCTGRGVCVEVAPDLFALDRFGYAYVRPGAEVAADAEARARAREAAARCPDAAIHVAPLPDRGDARPAGGTTLPVGDPGPRLAWARPQPEQLAERVAAGGYGPVDPTALAAAVEAAGLGGHGGAGFPTARKWASLAPGARVLVANAAEREPGTAKDRHLLTRRPHLVLDGVRATAAAIGADRAIVAVDAEATDARGAVAAAVAEAEAAGLLVPGAVEVRAVPARYVAGEETALLRALDGQPALPTFRPPYPTERGLRGRPTLVHNVETLAQVALIAVHGSEWFRAAGTPSEPGTGLFTVGTFGGEGRVVERPYGSTLSALVAEAGAVDAAAVLVGGWAGGLLPPGTWDVPLTTAALAEAGAALGTKSVQVVPAGTCPVGVAATVLDFFAQETAGQCPPCRDGLPWVAGALADLEAGALAAPALEEVEAFLATLPRRGACSLPDGAVRLARSLFRHFPALVEDHLVARCRHRSDPAARPIDTEGTWGHSTDASRS